MNKEIAVLGENISFYYKERMVLDNLSFSFYKGEHIGIVGESGCGKSTLLKLISGLLLPTKGTLKVNGATTPEEIRKQISPVMQEPMIMPLSVRENISLGHFVSDERIKDILKATMLTEWVDSLPQGVDTYLGNQANELSGGQAQRISIARAMAKNTDIILLDEPTSALDRTTGEGMLEALCEFFEGKTVIHVTHQTEMLKGYNRILRMEEGRLCE